MLMVAVLAGILGLITANLTQNQPVSRRLIVQVIIGIFSAAILAWVSGYVLLQWFQQPGFWFQARLPLMDGLTYPLLVETGKPSVNCTEGAYDVRIWLFGILLQQYSMACEPVTIMVTVILSSFMLTLFFLNLIPALLFALTPLYFIHRKDTPQP